MKNKKKGRDELNYGKQKKLTQNDNKNNEKEWINETERIRTDRSDERY